MQRLADRLIRRNGEGKTVTLRRANTLGSRNDSPVLVNGALADGATSMVIDSQGLYGDVQKGLAFTFASHDQVYTVTEAVQVAPNRTAAVVFEPSLPVPVADDEEVTFEAYVDHEFAAATADRLADEVRETADANLITLHLSAKNAPTVPLEGDFIIEGDEQHRISQVRAKRTGNADVAYTVTLGELAE